MWADVSSRTLGKYETEDMKSGCERTHTEDATDDLETEYSGLFNPYYNKNIASSNKGQIDLNSSFHGSMSQASWSHKEWGADMESSFCKDDDSMKAEPWGYNKNATSAIRGSEYGIAARERAATTTTQFGIHTLNQ